MEQCLTANDNNVDAVVASNDGTAGGVVAALASQGLAGNIPVSGQDGDIAALNRIAKGYQTVSAWKNACDLGRAGVDVAIALAEGTPADLRPHRTVLNGGQVVDTVRTQDVTKDQVLGMIILGKRIEEETEEDLASLH